MRRRSGIVPVVFAIQIAQSVGWTWSQETTTGDVTTATSGHTLTRVTHSGTTAGVICGGRNGATGALVSACYELTPPVAGASDASWVSRLVVLPAMAYPRAMHAAAAFGNFLLLLGGTTTDPDPTNPEVIDVNTWTRVPVTEEQFGGLPPAWRMQMASTTWRERFLFVHGGLTLDDGSDLSDAALLYLGDGVHPVFNWSSVRASCLTCATPGGRHGHAVAPWGRDTLVLVGGATESGAVLSDVWLLTYAEDRGTWAWQQRTAANAEALVGGSAHIVGDLLIYYGGTSGRGSTQDDPPAGVRVLQMTTFVWSKPAAAGDWLRRPLWAGVMLLPKSAGSVDSAETELVVCGGALANETVFRHDRPPPASTLAVIAVLRNIGVEPSSGPSMLLAAYIGGGAVAAFVSIIAMYAVWYRCCRYSADARFDEDASETTGLLDGSAALVPTVKPRSRNASTSGPSTLRQQHLQRGDGSGAGGIQMAAISARLRAGTAAAIAEAAQYAATSAALRSDGDSPPSPYVPATLPGSARYGSDSKPKVAPYAMLAGGSAWPSSRGERAAEQRQQSPHAFLATERRQRSTSTSVILHRHNSLPLTIPENTRSGESFIMTSDDENVHYVSDSHSRI